MSISVGIDLGTTYSAVAYVPKGADTPLIVMNSEGRKITPSLIRFVDGRTVFGTEAESAFISGEDGCAATFKRYMGSDDPYCVFDGKSYTPTDLSAILLEHLKQEAETELGDTIEDAVITVPAYFYSAEREATIRAAQKAGLKVKKIIDEPNAAAMAYGLNHWRENANILVYDLGGGTFDVTLTRMEKGGILQTIVTRGDHILGGRDWDDRMEGILINKLEDETGLGLQDDAGRRLIRGVCEETKKKLSAMTETTVKVSIPGYGYASVSVNRAEFDENTADLLERTGVLCRAVMDEAGLGLSDITDILLVGGSTRMPQVSAYLTKVFGKKPIAHINPDEAVALGAAIQSTKDANAYAELSVVVRNGKKETDRSKSDLGSSGAVKPSRRLDGVKALTVQETTAHAMGMIAVSEDGTRYINDVIIPANHPRPVKAAKAFSFQTRRRGSNEMEVYVLQGDAENPLDNRIPFRYVVTGLAYQDKTQGKTIVKVQYSYDDNGVINVEARQDNDTVSLPIRREPVPEDMSKYALPIAPAQMLPTPLNVVMAIDVSGSMSGAPLEEAKQAMCGFVDNLDLSYARVGVLAVSDRTEVVCELTFDGAHCKKKIKSICCGQTGLGNSAHPFYTIQRMLENEDGRLFAVILADGVWSGQQAAVEAAQECNRNGIETAAVGFGSADQNFLYDISSEDANAMFVSQSELTWAFGNIAQSLGRWGGGSDESVHINDIETWEG